jgi:hypothetical protein
MGERKERRKKSNCFASDMWVPHIKGDEVSQFAGAHIPYTL